MRRLEGIQIPTKVIPVEVTTQEDLDIVNEFDSNIRTSRKRAVLELMQEYNEKIKERV